MCLKKLERWQTIKILIRHCFLGFEGSVEPHFDLKVPLTQHVLWLKISFDSKFPFTQNFLFKVGWWVGAVGEGVGWVRQTCLVSILRHRSVQLKLAYSWAMPAILAAGKSRGGMFLFLVFLHFSSFIFLFHPNPSLSSLVLSLLSIYSLSLGDNTKWPTRVDVSFNPNTFNHFHGTFWIILINLGHFSLYVSSTSPFKYLWMYVNLLGEWQTV